MTMMLVAALSALGITAGSSPASAYAFNGCKWTLAKLDNIRYGQPSTYGTAVDEAAANWSTDAAWFGVDFDKATTNLDIGIVTANYGYTEWFGRVDLYCPGGTFQPWQVMELNTYWLQHRTKAERRSVAAHESGHLLGLAHSNIGSSCSAYPLMHASVNNIVGCTISRPRTDDLNGIYNRYY